MNRQTKIMIIVIFVLSILVMYNFININIFKEETTSQISGLSNSNSILTEDIQLVKIKTDILESQQQNLLIEDYDYLIYQKQDSAKYFVKSGLNNNEVVEMANLAIAFEFSFENGKIIKLKTGNYELNSNLIINNHRDIILDGQGSTINFNGFSITFSGNDYTKNNNNQIQNFVVINGTFRFENSFRATLKNMIFENCNSAVEVANTNKWSEASKLENIYWENCLTALTFKAPIGNATGSYENTALDRCYINLHSDNSVGIMVEKNANVSNSQWNNMRIWMHANESQKQTGLHLDGSMAETMLNDVIFESFGEGTIYGIYLGRYATTGFSLGVGSSFLGKFEARIKNDNDIWIYGTPSIFREKVELNSTKTNATITRSPLTISDFDIFIETQNLTEKIEIQIKLNFIDHSVSPIPIILAFNDNETYWLTEKDKYDLYPSQNVIWNIEPTLLTREINPKTTIIFGVIGTAR
jgi:hypothetical protein